MVPKNPNNLAPISKEIKTKTGGTFTSFFINKGVKILLSISWITKIAINIYNTVIHDPEETATSTISKIVVISGPTYGTKFKIPETKARISAYCIPKM